MNQCNYQGLFGKDEVKHALFLVEEFKARYDALAREESEDLLQQCLAHWYFKKDLFDPAKLVTRKTFMSSVIENFLTDIVKHNERKKRKENFHNMSLDTFAATFDPDFNPDYDKDNSEAYLAVEDQNFDEVLKTDLKKLLARARKKLSQRQREVCRLFQSEGLSMRDVSKRMNLPRATLFDEVLRIREVFKEEGLKDYL